MSKVPIVLAAAIAAALSGGATCGNKAPSQIVVPHSAYTGETYRDLGIVERSYYVAGILDGLMGSPLLGADQGLTEELHRCLLRFHAEQTTAIIDKWIADHPTDWQQDMHGLVLQALRSACPDFSVANGRYRAPH